jgi:DNA adenine methylase
MNAPTRPVLRWHGGKWKLAPWIIGHFPPHRVYVEPFGGAASVLLRKPRAYAEVYNDLDDEVVTLFRVLQDPVKAARLIELLKLTPFARCEFELSGEVAEDPIERSRRLVIRAFMGFGSNAHSSSTVALKNGFRSHTRGVAVGRQTGFRSNSNRSGTTPAQDWLNYPDCLARVVDRWRGVIIEHRPAERVIAQHDGPDTLHYVDPPYLPETRSPANKYDLKYRMYRHELDGGGHAALLEQLLAVSGMVALSGYPSARYDDVLTGWRRIETRAHADGARERTEVLWLNPACAAGLDADRAGIGSTPLFTPRAAVCDVP